MGSGEFGGVVISFSSLGRKKILLSVQCRQTPPPNAPVRLGDWGRAGPEVNPSHSSPCSSSHRLHRFFLPSATTLHLISDTGAATLLCRQKATAKKKKKRKRKNLVLGGNTVRSKDSPIVNLKPTQFVLVPFLFWFYFGSSTHILLPLCWFFFSCTVPCHCAVMPVVRKEKKKKEKEKALVAEFAQVRAEAHGKHPCVAQVTLDSSFNQDRITDLQSRLLKRLI